MVLFSGKATGRPEFYSIEATDGFDLCLKLFPDCDREDVPKIFRMWVDIAPATRNKAYWVDVCLALNNNGIFDIAMKQSLMDNGIVRVIIRGADEKSPNSSPDENTNKELKTPVKFVAPVPKNISFVTSTAGISLDSSKSFETYGAVNVVEPFTLVDITEASAENSTMKLVPLSFPKMKKRHVAHDNSVVLVDLESLESFVETEIEKGKSPLDLCLKEVRCLGGKAKNFPLTAHVWIGSILPHSRYFRFLFTTAAYAESCRTAQLKELKNNAPGLYEHLLFWVDDMLNFDEAKSRLEAHNDSTGVASFMSPYYFRNQEARYLGHFYLEGSTKTLKDKLDDLSKDEEVCTKTDLVPLMLRTFKIQKKELKEADYKEKKAAWMKQVRTTISPIKKPATLVTFTSMVRRKL
jgi:hypothetical protein